MKNAWLLLFVFVFPLPALACEIFEKFIVARDFVPVKIDLEQKALWLKAQRGKKAYYPLAKVLADNVRVIDRAEFEQGLKSVVKKTLKHVVDNAEAIFVHSEYEAASARWSIRYAKALVPGARKKSVVEVSRLFKAAEKVLAEGRELHIMALDDAAYSGSHLEGDAFVLLKTLMPLLQNPEHRSKIKIHVLRAVGNRAAHQRMENYLAKEFPEFKNQVSVDAGVLVPSLDEILLANKMPREKLPKDALQFYGVHRALKSLVIPFHKKPDSVSFPRALMFGRTFNHNASIPFIDGPQEQSGEPYRHPAYRSFYREEP